MSVPLVSLKARRRRARDCSRCRRRRRCRRRPRPRRPAGRASRRWRPAARAGRARRPGGAAAARSGAARRGAARGCCPGPRPRARPGGLWVADEGNHRVLRLDARLGARLPDRLLGGVTQPFELPERPSAKTLRSPAAVAVDETGSVFVADTGDHRVLAFDGD